MPPTIIPLYSAPLSSTATCALLAGGLSTATLVWRGRMQNRSAASGQNAIVSMVWPREALQRNDAAMRLTGAGAVFHYASSLLWAGLYTGLQSLRRDATVTNAVTDAAAVCALAAVVGLKLVPKRLSPGFEQRLSGRGLAWVFVCFGIGLAAGGVLAHRER
jgi:hypothetical protein